MSVPVSTEYMASSMNVSSVCNYFQTQQMGMYIHCGFEGVGVLRAIQSTTSVHCVDMRVTNVDL